MFKETMATLRENEQAPCISIILPMYRSKPESLQNENIIKNAMKKATTLVKRLDSRQGAEQVRQRLQNITKDIDFNYMQKGVGIFIAPGFSKIVHLPFSVEETVHVGEQFVIRDLVYATNRYIDYWVLHLSANHTRLYRGAGQQLDEINDRHFPTQHEEEYERKKSSQLPTEYGDDEGRVPNTRLKQYFQKIDKRLNKYLTRHPYPLLLVGVKKYIGYFKQVSKHQNKIVQTMTGNYDHLSPAQLALKVWPRIEEYQEQQLAEKKKQLRESVGTSKATSGFSDVWQSVQEGRGQQLFLEKGLHHSGYINKNKYNFYDSPVKGKKLQKIDDAVNALINEVLQRDGEIYFLENDALQEYDRIALIERY